MRSRIPNRAVRVLLMSGALALAGALAAAGPAAAGGSHTWYVSGKHGDDGNSGSKAHPFRTIAHAVSAAAAGDRIDVGPGGYHESITITKKLTLRGHHATIDATGKVNGLVIQGSGAAWSKVTGFQIKNATGEGLLAVSTWGLTISRNHIKGNDKGANTNATPECAPQGNVPGDCGEALHLMGVSESKVIGNLLELNEGGILVTDETGPAKGNLIAWNVSRNNMDDCGITLPSHNPLAASDPTKGGVYDNVIVHNISMGNGGAGVGFFAPFPGAASYDNVAAWNTLKNNGEAGAAVHGHAPGAIVTGNKILFNHIAGNGVDPDAGSGHPTGIALLTTGTAADETVAGNWISREYWGVFTAGPITTSGLSSNHDSSSVTHAHN